MPAFVRPDGPNPPIRSEDWAPSETVTLRPRLTWAMEAEANNRAYKLPEGVDLSHLSPAEIASLYAAHIDPKAALQYRFEAMITEWTLTFDDGTPAPLSPEMIAQLPKSYADFISAEIAKRGGALGPEHDKGPGGDPTTLKSNSRSEEHSSIELVRSSSGKSTKRA